MAPQQNPNESPLVAAAAVAAVPTSSIEGADCSALVGFEGCDPWRAEAAHRWFYFARGSCWPWEPRRPMCAAGRNRFRTTEDCREVCEHGADARSRLDCTSAVYPRRCDVMGSWVFPYYYDWAKARCLHHRGRSCLLAPNRFRAFVECNRACAACPNCTDERCEAAILSGDCSLELKAFQAYFDTRTQTCRPWTDICLAPPNRFRNESECRRRCLSRH
ncbi:papilin-like [Haemaphysalis longicornis]